LKKELEFGSLDRESEWLKAHTLTKEQVRQLILNKFERAKKDQENLEAVRSLVKYTD